MAIFPWNYNNYPRSASVPFKENFPRQIDLDAPSQIPGFREPLLDYLAQHSGALKESQISQYGRALKVLEQELMTGRITLNDLRGKIFDFGVDEGGSSLLMSQLSDEVYANEINSAGLSALEQTGLFPSDRLLFGDGFSYLADSDVKYDLITGFLLGELNASRSFIESFLQSAADSLRSTGKILISSDIYTIDTARQILGIPYRTEFNPQVIVGSSQGWS